MVSYNKRGWKKISDGTEAVPPGRDGGNCAVSAGLFVSRSPKSKTPAPSDAGVFVKGSLANYFDVPRLRQRTKATPPASIAAAAHVPGSGTAADCVEKLIASAAVGAAASPVSFKDPA